MPGNLNIGISPAEVLSWPAPNYIDPVRRTCFPVIAGVLLGLATLMVVARLWLRARWKAGRLGLDDALLVPGWVASVAFTTCAILASRKYGMDRHVWDAPPNIWPHLALTSWIAEVMYFTSTSCIKISVLLFYRRLAAEAYNNRWKWMSLGAIIFVACFGFTIVILLIFNCRPTNAYWRSFDPTYHQRYKCIDTKALNWVTGAIAATTDLYAVMLPCMILRNLNTSRRQKVALNLLFGMGLLTVGAGIARMYYIGTIDRHPDVTWYSFYAYLTAQLEIMLGIICASAPSMRVLINTYVVTVVSQAYVRSKQYASSVRSRSKSKSSSRQASCETDEKAQLAGENLQHEQLFGVLPSRVGHETDLELAVRHSLNESGSEFLENKSVRPLLGSRNRTISFDRKPIKALVRGKPAVANDWAAGW